VADEPDAKEVRVLDYGDWNGRRSLPPGPRPPETLDHAHQVEGSKAWAEVTVKVTHKIDRYGREWTKLAARVKVTHKKYRYSRKSCQKPDSAPAKVNKRLASRLDRLKIGHCLAGQYLQWTKDQTTVCGRVLVVSLQDPDAGASFQELSYQHLPWSGPSSGHGRTDHGGPVQSGEFLGLHRSQSLPRTNRHGRQPITAGRRL